jgi:hypothetical protein
MNELIVHLPEALHRSIEALAKEEGYTVDQFIAAAAAQKMAAMRKLEYFRQEGAGARREDFERFLQAIPAADPVPRRSSPSVEPPTRRTITLKK